MRFTTLRLGKERCKTFLLILALVGTDAHVSYEIEVLVCSHRANLLGKFTAVKGTELVSTLF